MRRKTATIWVAAATALVLTLGGCGQAGTQPSQTPESAAPTEAPSSQVPESAAPTASKRDAIPFAEGQLYAAAYLGYQTIDDWDYYVEQYLDSGDVPTYFVSDGDYYLVIPRYDDMEVALYANDMETGASEPRFEAADCGPFLLQCNVSDIFPDATIRFTYNGETVEFSPFLSLENGAPMMGERGLDLTKPA